MMIMFEATVSMSRLKNIKTLRGMGNKPYTIQAYRSGKWIALSTEKLLPGDLISVKKKSNSTQDSTANSNSRFEKIFFAIKIESDGVVPCDCLILRGSTVVNEASLTGESVPQMKEGLSEEEIHQNPTLDIKGQHKVCLNIRRTYRVDECIIWWNYFTSTIL
jgi:cation-transporting ATPase 13A1